VWRLPRRGYTNSGGPSLRLSSILLPRKPGSPLIQPHRRQPGPMPVMLP
jgi:hypothetical protein